MIFPLLYSAMDIFFNLWKICNMLYVEPKKKHLLDVSICIQLIFKVTFQKAYFFKIFILLV